MRYKGLVIVLALAVLGAGAVFGQSHLVNININPVAILAIHDAATAVSLETTGVGVDPGDPVLGTSGDKAIFYTVLADGTPYRIEARRSDGAGVEPPAGTRLLVSAGLAGLPPNAGVGAGTVELTPGNTSIITAIGSVATGRNPANPPSLTYTLDIVDSTALVAGASATVTVTLTLTDA